MARKIVNITHSANRYDILSQTPKNYDKDNYFIKELQDKVNAEWEYRPNRVDIEYENCWGEQTYSPIEVVIQSVKSEKSAEISNDYKSIVFKNILDDRFSIGSRFRFGDFRGRATKDIPEDKKNIWLAINTNSVKLTSSMVIERCNGTLGSLYTDSQGVAHYHYEPVIQKRDLSAVSFLYNEAAVSPQAQLEITAQHNDYTSAYFINQRFIIGYDRVYRLKAVNKFYSNSTFDPRNVGLIKMYLELTEESPYDNFDSRIAYQDTGAVVITDTNTTSDDYSIKFTTPKEIPSNLTDQPVIFTPVVLKKDGTVDTSKKVQLSCFLENLPETVSINNYINIIETDDTVSLVRKRVYFRGSLILTWIIVEDNIPVGVTTSFTMSLRE